MNNKGTTYRILQIVGTMNMGGQETFIMNVFRNIDRNKIQFDFIVHSIEEGYYEQEIKDLGGKIYKITPISKNPIKHCKELLRIMKKNNYVAIHRHTNSSIVFLDLMMAKFANIKQRVVHSHSTKVDKDLVVHKICRPLLNLFATKRLACSREAGEWLYGKKRNYEIIPNGINIEKYKYNEKERNKIRKELKIENKTVIGHVGRFTEAKNHKFLLDILEKIKDKNYILLLVGSGKLENEIKAYANKLKIYDNIIFLGTRNDVYNLLNAMDIFVFPSIYEGLPISLIEAQTNGLKCIISDAISKEVCITDLVQQLDLKFGVKNWVNEILKEKNKSRVKYNDIVKNTKYNVENVVNTLKKIYINE